MKNVNILFFIFLTIHKSIFSGFIYYQPPESVLIKLPQGEEKEWKEISRVVAGNSGVVYRIPHDQNADNWKKMLTMDCSFYESGSPVGPVCNQLAIESMKSAVTKNYSKYKTSFNVIEENNHSFIYEVFVQKEDEGNPLIHEICRVFVRQLSLCSIKFTTKELPLSSSDKQCWIDLFRNSTSVVPHEEAMNSSTGLSIPKGFPDNLDLGPTFYEWPVISTYGFSNNAYQITRVSPKQKADYVAECLEVTSMPFTKKTPMEKVYEVQKEMLQAKTTKKATFELIELNTNELIFYYAYPKDFLTLNGISRVFFHGSDYYAVTYIRGLPNNMEKRDILSWANELKLIKNTITSNCKQSKRGCCYTDREGYCFLKW